MSYYNILKEADMNGESREEVANKRIAELREDIAEYSKDYNSGVNAVTAQLIHNLKMRAYEEIDFLERHKIKKESDSKITDEDIRNAKRYPIEKLIEFKNGKAEAWCHADKNPSLNLWRSKNLAYCFVCSKSFDSIDVVMEQDGCTFHEAVRRLI